MNSVKQQGLRWVVVIGVVLVAIAVAMIVPMFVSLITPMGRYIPHQEDLVADYVFAIYWSLLIGWTVFFWPVPSRHKTDLCIAWLLRIATVLGYFLIIEWTAPDMDAYQYYEVPKRKGFEWSGLQFGLGQEGTVNIYQLVYLHDRILPDSFHALMVTWAMLGLLASYLFYRAAIIIIDREDRRLFYVFAITPSILQWASRLGKEPVSLLGMAIYVYGVVAWSRNGGRKHLLYVLLGLFIVVIIRPWYGPIMLVPLVVFGLAKSRAGVASSAVGRTFLLGGLGAGTVIVLGSTGLSEAVSSSDALVETTNSASASFARGGSSRAALEVSGPLQLLLNLPYSMFSALFRPLPGEVPSLFGILASLENVAILGLTIIALWRARLSDFREPLVGWAVLVTLLWAAQYGTTAAANLGSLVRYRVQILPIFLGLLLYLIFRQRAQRMQRTEASSLEAQNVH